MNKIISRLVLSQLVFYFLLFFSFNNKTFFPLVFFFALYLFWLLEDWRQAAWLVLVAVLPFGWGLRTWRVVLPLPFQFWSDAGMPFWHFSLSAKFIVSLFLFLVLAFKRGEKKLIGQKEDFFLIGFLFLALLSFLTSSYLGLFILLGLFQAALIYFLSKHFLAGKKIFKLTVYSLFVMSVFEGFLALAQLWLRRPLGKIIEESLFASPYGMVAAEDMFRFRASGSFTDPNSMAVFWLIILPLVLSQVVGKKPLIQGGKLILASFLFSLVGLLSTFSRAAWIVFFVVLWVMIASLIRKKLFSIRSRLLLYASMIFFLLLSPVLIKRMMSLQRVFWTQHSSALARLDLIKEAWMIIKQKPLLGVGPGHFLPAMAANNFTGVMSHFPYPVHSLYFLVASELGLPALLFLWLFLGSVLKKGLFLEAKNKTRQGLKIGLLGGVFAYLLAVLFYMGRGVGLEFFFLFLGLVASL